MEGESNPQEQGATARAAAVLAAARAVFSRALDAVLPPQCPVTGEKVAAPGLLSPAGWAQIRFIDDPVCARCGTPFLHDDYGEGATCAGCMAEPPAFESARAAAVYDEAAHKLVVAFKHSDRTELTALLGGWLVRAGAPLLREGTILVPAPLHARRLFTRRYNQAALLAAEVARRTGLALLPDALVRVRATPPQQRLSAAARKRNVAGAFAAGPARAPLLAGAHVVLIDDVLTTGATLSACARALKKAGARRVDALVLARVARGGIDAI